MKATQEHEPEHGVAWRTSDERSGRSEVDRLDRVAKAESYRTSRALMVARHCDECRSAEEQRATTEARGNASGR
jgi:hypothetical protein